VVKGPEGMIQVYETPGMGLLDKKSIKVVFDIFNNRLKM
jgi:hypothetical protein